MKRLEPQMAQKAQMDEGRGEGTTSPGAAVEAVCPDWHELSEHQRVRSVELFEAGRRFEAMRMAGKLGQQNGEQP